MVSFTAHLEESVRARRPQRSLTLSSKWAIVFTTALLFTHTWAAEPTEFKHMEQVKKCSLCHRDLKKPFELWLLDGTRISREESIQICSQCHGVKRRDWDLAIHGFQNKRPCLECHEPHAPKFKQLQAVPPPKKPPLGIPKGEHP